MMNALLVPHTLVAIATAILFLFQMTMLVASINAHIGETTVSIKTYMRSTSKKEAAARAR